MDFNVKLHSPGIWCFINSIDNRIHINASRNVLRGMCGMLHKLMNREHTLPPQLIKDYWDNKLQFKCLDSCGNDHPIIMDINRNYWIDKLTYNKYNNYKKNWFVHLSVERYIGLDGSERSLVFARIAPKQKSSTKSMIIGVWDRMSQAKDWCRWAYGEYDKNAIDKLVMCNTPLTKSTLQNPLLMDKKLLELYKRVYDSN